MHGCIRSVLFDVFCSFISYQNNATLLYVASEKGHHDVVQTLLGAGADLNIVKYVSHVMFYYCSVLDPQTWLSVTIHSLTKRIIQSMSMRTKYTYANTSHSSPLNTQLYIYALQ